MLTIGIDILYSQISDLCWISVFLILSYIIISRYNSSIKIFTLICIVYVVSYTDIWIYKRLNDSI